MAKTDTQWRTVMSNGITVLDFSPNLPAPQLEEVRAAIRRIGKSSRGGSANQVSTAEASPTVGLVATDQYGLS